MSKVQPVVGMGATQIMWSDRHAYTIIEVCSPRRIVVQRDTATRVSGSVQDGSAVYKYEADLNGPCRFVTLRKNGRWIQQGESMKTGTLYQLGNRDTYIDPSF